jgi:hypothetical protein
MSEVLAYERVADMLRETLNENWEPLKLPGTTIYAGDAMKATDPIAFRCAVADYASLLVEDGYLVEGVNA